MKGKTNVEEVVLISRNPMVTDDLEEKLHELRGIEVVSVFNERSAIVDMCRKKPPSIIIADLNDLESWEMKMIRVVQRYRPEVRLICLYFRFKDIPLLSFMQTGFHGFLQRGASERTCHRVIREVVLKGFHASNDMAIELMEQIMENPVSIQSDQATPILNKDQLDILKLISKGLSNKEVAAHIGISDRTLEGKKTKILKHLSCKNVSEATRKAIRAGWMAA